jgi:ABC-type Fe3+/spermidine/putrescine transport system ATPase subunit
MSVIVADPSHQGREVYWLVIRAPFIRLSEVRMEGLGKRYGRLWAVRDLALSIRPGDFYSVLGPAGSGKTTLLRMLAGLVRPDAGRILLDDEPIDPVPPDRRNVGMLFPHGSLWPHLSVFDNVAFGLRARGTARDEVARRVRAALAWVGAEDLESLRPSALSGSQPQRVALARALVVEPRLLLLDEPLSGLEDRARAEMRALIARLAPEVGITTVHATRDRSDALALSTRVAVLSEGRVCQEGRPQEIYWRPRHRFVAEWVGEANVIPVRVVEVREVGVVVQTAGGVQVPVAAGERAWTVGARGLLCLRPDALAIEEAALAGSGIPGRVAAQRFEGPRQLFEVAIAGGVLRLWAITSVLRGGDFKPGDEVKVEVLPETAVLLPDEGPPG